MLLARQSKNVPGFQTLLLHFEIRDVAPEPLHYFVPILVQSTAAVLPPYLCTTIPRGAAAVIYLHHKILRRVPWNGRNICQDNVHLDTCVIITKLIRLRRLLPVDRNRQC
jgi:hypothetical protein